LPSKHSNRDDARVIGSETLAAAQPLLLAGGENRYYM
jgi:hypothetical protein